jgi:hypothetical protein
MDREILISLILEYISRPYLSFKLELLILKLTLLLLMSSIMILMMKSARIYVESMCNRLIIMDNFMTSLR